MTSYRCMQMYVSGDHVIVQTTDYSSVGNEIRSKFRELLNTTNKGKLAIDSSYPYHASMTHLKDSLTTELFYWEVLRFLCVSGWEPFSIEGVGRTPGVWLRRFEDEG